MDYEAQYPSWRKTNRRPLIGPPWLLLVVLGVLVVAVWVTPTASAHPLDREDQALLEKLKRVSSEAAEHYLEAENLVDAGRASEAIALFGEVSETEKSVSLAARRQCELLTAAGRRDQALAACADAVMRRAMPKELLAKVRAILGRAELTPQDLSEADILARLAVMRGGAEPWGYAATCEIASRMDDVAMLRECTSELERRAPGHVETNRAKALIAAKSAPSSLTLGWLAIGVLLLGTLAHALLDRLRCMRKRWAPLGATAALTLLTGLCVPGSVQAESREAVKPDAGAADPEKAPAEQERYFHGLGVYAIDTLEPSRSVPSPQQRDRDPIQYGYFVMDLGDLADRALKKGDHRAAARFYAAMATAAPENAAAFSKVCEEYEVLSEREKGIRACTNAVARPLATSEDYARLSRLVLGKEGKLDEAELGLLDEVVVHLKRELGGATLPHEIECQVGTKNHDQSRLAACVKALTDLSPDSPRLVPFQWALAMERRKVGDACGAIDRARSLALDPALIGQMVRATAAIEPWWWKAWKEGWGLPLAGATAVAAVVLLLLLRALKGRDIEEADRSRQHPFPTAI